jgi:hypothetical protein
VRRNESKIAVLKRRSKKSTPFLHICKSPLGAIFKGKFQGDYLPQINENAILGFRQPDQKNAKVFFVTKCVDLKSMERAYFF